MRVNKPKAPAARYGVPYKGSKNLIAEAVCERLPHWGFSRFVGLFAGGCAISHRMLTLPTGYGRFIMNDLDGQGVRLFLSAVRGDFRNERRWVSREEFRALKAADPYVSILTFRLPVP